MSHVSPAEDGAEEVREGAVAEQVIQVHLLDVAPALAGGPLAPVEVAGCAALLPLAVGLAQLVVAGALGGVAQHLVGFVDLFKVVLGLLVTRVAVGVIFHGQLAVHLFDLVRRGAARDAEDLIVVAIFHKSLF